MHVKKTLQGLMAILLPLISLSQKSYSVGDTLAPPLFAHLKNQAQHPDAELYILTFFSPMCAGSCATVITNSNLQTQFPHVAFLNFTRYNDAAVRRKITTANNTTHWQDSDTIFSIAFPYLRVPHIAIVNNLGVVNAITSGKHLSAKNIRKLLNNPGTTLPTKHDIPYNIDKSLLANLQQQNTEPGNYTFITPYIEGIPAASSRKWDSSLNCTRVTAINANPAKLYALAFRKWLLRPWQVEIDTTLNNSFWCFEFSRPHRNDSIVNAQLLTFLDAFFRTSASFQTKKVQYLALIDTLVTTPLQNNGFTAAQLYNTLRSNPSLPFIENEAISKQTLPASLVQQLENQHSIPAINQHIRPYGFTIAPRSVVTGVLVIKSHFSSQNTKLQ